MPEMCIRDSVLAVDAPIHRQRIGKSQLTEAGIDEQLFAQGTIFADDAALGRTQHGFAGRQDRGGEDLAGLRHGRRWAMAGGGCPKQIATHRTLTQPWHQVCDDRNQSLLRRRHGIGIVLLVQDIGQLVVIAERKPLIIGATRGRADL